MLSSYYADFIFFIKKKIKKNFPYDKEVDGKSETWMNKCQAQTHN